MLCASCLRPARQPRFLAAVARCTYKVTREEAWHVPLRSGSCGATALGGPAGATRSCGRER